VTRIPAALRRLVYDRAKGGCEYCLIHDDDAFMPHEIDHIFAEKHGGETAESNLCLSCAICNRNKGSDLASLDPETGEREFLYHPRRDAWEDHFVVQDNLIIGKTPKGRATAQLLKFNIPERVIEREGLIALRRYPVGK